MLKKVSDGYTSFRKIVVGEVVKYCQSLWFFLLLALGNSVVVRASLSFSYLKSLSEESFLWHARFFSIGLLLEKPWFPVHYPFAPHFFSLHQLAPKQGRGVVIALLDSRPSATPPSTAANCNCEIQSHHSIYAQALLTGTDEMLGFAPHAKLIFTNSFGVGGSASKDKIRDGLSLAASQHAHIVIMNFKIDEPIDAFDSRIIAIQSFIDKIPYIVAAAGNDARLGLPFLVAYPGRLPHIAFDVGSFSYENNCVAISPFSQYCPGLGPKIVAPGQKILSLWEKKSMTQNDKYAYASGTSISAAIVGGFLALVLGEFDAFFTRKQILTACYACTIHLNNSPNWHERSLFGVIDFRMALYMLHMLHFLLAKYVGYKKVLTNDTQFVELVLKIRHFLLAPLKAYGQPLGIVASFDQDALSFVQEAQTKIVSRPAVSIEKSSLDQIIEQDVKLFHKNEMLGPDNQALGQLISATIHQVTK